MATFPVDADSAFGNQGPRKGEMSDYDPDEMVNFENKYVSLWAAVHDIMTQPPVRRTGIAVFRAEGLEPSFFEAEDIERMAQLPAFKGYR
jgi:hypothetical protein